mgnify:CR=1 FL=1
MSITKKNKKKQKKTKKKTKKGQKIGKRISRIIRERLQTSTKVEVCEYHELCFQGKSSPNGIL